MKHAKLPKYNGSDIANTPFLAHSSAQRDMTPESVFHATSSDMGKGIAAATGAAAGLAGAAIRSRVSGERKKSKGSILPITIVPRGHMALRKRFGLPLLQKDGTPKVVDSGWNRVMSSSLIPVSVQKNYHILTQEGVEHPKGQLKVVTGIGWAIGKDPHQLYRAHFNFENGKHEILEEAVIGLVASGLLLAIRTEENPLSIDDDHLLTKVSELRSEQLDERCGVVLTDINVRDIYLTPAEKGAQVARAIGRSVTKLLGSQGVEIPNQETPPDELGPHLVWPVGGESLAAGS